MKILIAMTLSLSLNTAFESGLTGPEALFPYCRAVQDTGSPLCVINPALVPFCAGLTATASGGRPYYGYGLDSASASAQYGGTGFGLSGRWNSFGDKAYRENSFFAGAGFAPAWWLGAGVTGNIYSLKINCGDIVRDDIFYDFGAGLIIMPAEWMQAGFMAQNIKALICENTSIYGEWSCGLLTKPCRGLSVSWDLTDTPAGKINTFVLTVNPLEFLSSGFGYSVETSSFSMNIGFMFRNAEFNYGIRFHPYLGYSHSVSITYSGSGKTEPLVYGNPANLPEKRINIKTASYDELSGLGILSETSARRIILYREEIGPLTRNALVRIGLTPPEIRMLVAVSYGFEKNRKSVSPHFKKKSYNKKKYVPRKVLVKRKFREMTDEGIPAYQASLYSDMCTSGDNGFIELLDADHSIAEEQKKIIRRICGR